MHHSVALILIMVPSIHDKWPALYYYRLALGTLLSAVLFPSLYQPALSGLWQYLYKSSFYRFSGFETLLTIISYIIIEPLYTYKFGKHPHLRIDVRGRQNDAISHPKLPKMRRPQQRLGEIAVYIGPLLFLDFTLIKKFAGVPIEDIRASGGYSPVPEVQEDNLRPTGAVPPQISSTFLLPTLHNFSSTSLIQSRRALPPLPPTSRQLILQLAAAFFIYDALFFFIHIAFHRLKLLSRIHLPHHTHGEMHPQVTNKLSVTERVSLIMLANFALNIISSHVLTRTCFVLMFVWLLVEVHCGLELQWGYDKLLPRGWGAGARAHAWHHKTGQGGYAPFFGWWDAGLEMFDSWRSNESL